jgi:hypothetical protein
MDDPLRNFEKSTLKVHREPSYVVEKSFSEFRSLARSLNRKYVPFTFKVNFKPITE